MPGHHRIAQSFLVRSAFNLTLLGSTSVNHALHDTRPILHIASIRFHNINYLELTGIIVITSYELKASPFAALEFTNIFTLQVSQIAVHSESSGVDIQNVFGNSVIEHSSFDTISHMHGAHISINFSDRPVDNLIMLILNKIPAKISIQDCIFTNAVGQSISALFFLNSFPIQIDISNITTLGQQENDITYCVVISSKCLLLLVAIIIIIISHIQHWLDMYKCSAPLPLSAFTLEFTPSSLCSRVATIGHVQMSSTSDTRLVQAGNHMTTMTYNYLWSKPRVEIIPPASGTGSPQLVVYSSFVG